METWTVRFTVTVRGGAPFNFTFSLEAVTILRIQVRQVHPTSVH